MPRCIHCNESYAEQLRRCPYCGETPEAGPSSRRGAGQPATRGALPKRQRSAQRTRILALLGLLLVAGGAGFVYLEKRNRASDAATRRAAIHPHHSRPPHVARRLPEMIRRDKLDESFEILYARLEGAQIVVAGHCSPNAVVRVTVAGVPAVIEPRGDRFRAVVPSGQSQVDVVLEDINGKTLTRKVNVDVAELPGQGPKRVQVLNHAEGETVHTASVRLELEGVAKAVTPTVTLLDIENDIELAQGRFRLYRAPEGLVFLRMSDRAHYVFLRLIDEQEVVLIPAGLSRRGMGKETPHGPMNVLKMSPFMIDRTEISCRQYAVFLRLMLHSEDRSLRHPSDPGAPLLPLGWEDEHCPEGWEDLPVTGVTWYAAYAYARWVGGRLPTEAQWERAAAGPIGLPYPWGAEFDPKRCSRGAKPGLAPAASLPSGESPYSLLHMCGNAREWCDDRYAPDWYTKSWRTDPRGPSRNHYRVVRGGSCVSPKQALRNQHRDHANPEKQAADIGFRVVMNWPGFSESDGESAGRKSEEEKDN